MLKLGAHVSTAGGLYQAIENGTRLGARAVQFFGSSPRQWSVKFPSKTEIEAFQKHWKESEIAEVYLHASYLVNLASDNADLWFKSVDNLTAHLKIVEMLGANGLIFHVGSAKDGDNGRAVKKVAEGMRLALESVPGKAQLILENGAGGGTKIGSDPEEIGRILKLADSPRAKFCLDTAHIFESGIIKSYESDNIKKLLKEIDRHIGLENLVAMHINDSKSECDSHHDRHENLGVGKIGLEGFRNLASEKSLHNKAWMLEVPGFDDLGPDKDNLDILKSCFVI
ncbi:MAG: apurinic endonuclease APN1 [Parcubacteria group bacterium Gr01-1014_3]|nr:MAG: apurinic endonuclease APN1 [Parcubacteria group bacterium Gr01-1014_3]